MVEYEKMEETCRLCDETSGQMFNIFDKNADGYQILQVIKECVPVIVSNSIISSTKVFITLI